MKILRSSKEIEISKSEFLEILSGYNRFVIDIGTGQGAFVYHNALYNKECFYIGLDACADSMKKYSIKQYKKRIKNLVYVVMNAQNIDDILFEKFSEIYINLPWGSLLEGIFNEDLNVIKSISMLCKRNCKINICFSYDERFEEREIVKRNLPKINEECFADRFKLMYKKYGIDIKSFDCVSKEELKFESKWKYVLNSSRNRMFYLIYGEKI